MGVRILIVDDHPVVCEGFSQLFEFVDGIDVVGTAGTAREGMERIDLLLPDVVLLDLHLPDQDGVAVAAALRTRHPDIRVVIFTAGADPADVRRARAAGVDGLLLKTMPVGELIRAIREVAGGREVVDRDLAGALSSPDEDTGLVPLSDREHEVLRLLSEGMTNKDVAAALFISRATVKSHIENILRKLEASDRAAAVAEGFRRGLLRV
ncbi:MAG TPA: response regulator transcription factor [Acidimicrobiales bacterium]|jgi:DNA-binding NarL/FixJ family response regulator|nr:response regulator transcription factor [Acidimicrobiales bacterium]